MPVLINILPTNYWYLLCLYAFGVRLLYEPTSEPSISLANKFIDTYHIHLEEMFGNRAYTYTIHAHTHLAYQVKLHGPLQTHSQFVFEVNNFLNF